MSIFDLIFLLTFFTVVILVVNCVVNLLRGRHAQSKARFYAAGSLVVSYFLILIVVSLYSPQRVIARAQDQCFDDWCIAVVRAQTIRADPGWRVLTVQFRLSNHAAGRTQRETGISVLLLDSKGSRYPVSQAQQSLWQAKQGVQAPFDVEIPLQGSIFTDRLFSIPAAAHPAAILVSHGHGVGNIIIGDGDSLFHKRTLMSVE